MTEVFVFNFKIITLSSVLTANLFIVIYTMYFITVTINYECL